LALQGFEFLAQGGLVEAGHRPCGWVSLGVLGLDGHHGGKHR
jgi:hypothetical protein